MKNSLLVLLLVVLTASALRAQYVIEYPYLFFDNQYSAPTIGFTYYTLPRPTEAYTSTRVRALSSGFTGLIKDSYTDHFRNPAMDIGGLSCEAFGDFGSVNDLGRFVLGGFIKGGKTTVGASTTLDRLLKRTTSSHSTYSYSPQSPSTQTYDDKSEINPERLGGRISGTFHLAGGHNLGASYEYINNKNNARYESSTMYTSPNYVQSSMTLSDFSSSSDLHSIGIGGMIETNSGTLQLIGRGVFSTATLTNRYSRFNRYSSATNSNLTDYPSDVRTTAFLLGGVYELPQGEESSLRLLLDFAYTSYTTSGTSIGEAVDSGSYIYKSTLAGSRTSDGTIFDVRGGVGYQRHIIGAITGYAGFSVGYIRNSYDATERSTSSTTTIPPNPPQPPITTTNVSNGTIDGFDVRLPLGLDVALGDHVVLLGGIEPRYRSGETSTENRSTIFPPSSIINATNKINQRGLIFASQFGVTAHHEDYGEISVVFGKNLTDTSFWTFFLRYFV